MREWESVLGSLKQIMGEKCAASTANWTRLDSVAETYSDTFKHEMQLTQLAKIKCGYDVQLHDILAEVKGFQMDESKQLFRFEIMHSFDQLRAEYEKESVVTVRSTLNHIMRARLSREYFCLFPQAKEWLSSLLWSIHLKWNMLSGLQVELCQVAFTTSLDAPEWFDLALQLIKHLGFLPVLWPSFFHGL